MIKLGKDPSGRYKPDENQSMYANLDVGVVVYEGVDTVTGGKIVWKERICTEGICTSLLTAYSLQSRISHPNVCEVLHFFSEPVSPSQHRCVLVTPYYPTDLQKEVINRKRKGVPWSEGQVRRIMMEMVSCLAFCQENGVSHRDVKPANVFLTKEGEVKIGDFETIRVIEGFSKQYTFAGTAPYLSPALRTSLANCEGRLDHDPVKSDVYSLGITLLELILLETPDLCTIYHLQERINSLLNCVSDQVPFKSIIRKMLTIDENSRPDFLSLQSELTSLDMSPSHRRLSIKSPPANLQCSACHTSTSVFICLCDYPILQFCEKCAEIHQNDGKNTHFNAPFAVKKVLNSSQKVDSARNIAKIYENLQKNLEEIVKNIEKTEKTINEIYEKRINSIRKIREKDLNFLNDYKAKISNIQTKFHQHFTDEILGKTHFSPKISSLPRSFFTCQVTEREIPLISPVLISINENLNTVNHVNSEISLAIPSLRNRLYLFNLGERVWKRSFVNADVSLDEGTVFTSVSQYELLGIGGVKHPTQAFFLDIFNGTFRLLSDMSRGREGSGGVIAVNHFAYVFGGGFSPQSEKLSLSTNRFEWENIEALPENIDNCNPAYRSGSVYLVGRILWEYNLEMNAYREIKKIKGNFHLISTICLDDFLYIFSSERSARFDFSRRKITYLDRLAVGFWSNPSPVYLQNTIYLICKADAQVLSLSPSALQFNASTCPFESSHHS